MIEPTLPTRNQEHVSLAIGGAELEVVSLRGEHRLSRLFSFDLVCRAPDLGVQAGDLVGRGATITLRDGFGASRSISGIVAEAAVETFDDGSGVVTVEVRPHHYSLTLGRDCRVFQESSVVDIAEKVLAGKPFRLALTRSYPVRVYTAQYREDDWTFLCRLLEEEGIYIWFDHEAGSTLVLADDSTAAPDLVGGARVPFHYETGMRADTELIEELASEVSVTPTSFSVSSFDPGRPALKVKGGSGGGALEVYHAPGGGPSSPAICEARAKTKHETAIAGGSGAAGLSTSVRLVPGMVFAVVDHPLPSLDGRYLVTEVVYEASQRRRMGGTESNRAYSCRFRAIRAAASYRPPAETPPGKQAGLQTGIVIGAAGAEIHTSPTGAVRVQLHWDRGGARDDKSGKWMRVAQRGTADSMLLPRIGWTVLTFNEEGTVDAPSVLSRIHDGEHLPPYGLPGNKTRVVFKTATSPGGGSHNEIYFEDKLGAEEMFIHASKDHNVHVKHIKRESVVKDSTRKVGVDHVLTVGNDKVEGVKVNHTVSVGANETTTVKAGRGKDVKGDETAKIAGSRSLTAASAAIQVAKTRSLKVGAALLDISLGSVGAQSGGIHTMLVGGAAVKMSAKSVSETIGKVAIQTVGGAKLEFSQKSRSIDVRKNLNETVGAMAMLKTNGTYIDHADKTLAVTTGGTTKGTAPEILIQADTKIQIKCGKSVITITEDTVAIDALNLDLSKCTDLVSQTQIIEHNS